jgi:hypothetical protein
MKPAPLQAAIDQAELRFARSSRNVSSSVRRARAAFGTTLSRPSTLVKVAAVSGLFCFWLARRTGPRPGNTAQGLRDTIVTSVLGLLTAFILRYGMRRLAVVFR